jgi:hypothetical protein
MGGGFTAFSCALMQSYYERLQEIATAEEKPPVTGGLQEVSSAGGVPMALGVDHGSAAKLAKQTPAARPRRNAVTKPAWSPELVPAVPAVHAGGHASVRALLETLNPLGTDCWAHPRTSDRTKSAVLHQCRNHCCFNSPLQRGTATLH